MVGTNLHETITIVSEIGLDSKLASNMRVCHFKSINLNIGVTGSDQNSR